MTPADVAAVVALDEDVKPSPWTADGFLGELTNACSFPQVLTAVSVLCGYIVYWLVADELTINTIVVAPAWRGHGLGDYLLWSALTHGRGQGVTLASLEVRASNEIAQNLYRKYEFAVVGRRPRYYRDNQEDALIMLAEGVDQPAYGQLLATREAALRLRLQTHGRV